MIWHQVLIGIGIGMVAGFFLACVLGLSKESDRQAEVDFMRLKLAELERNRG